jgi:hypothetical protein
MASVSFTRRASYDAADEETSKSTLAHVGWQPELLTVLSEVELIEAGVRGGDPVGISVRLVDLDGLDSCRSDKLGETSKGYPAEQEDQMSVVERRDGVGGYREERTWRFRL